MRKRAETAAATAADSAEAIRAQPAAGMGGAGAGPETGYPAASAADPQPGYPPEKRQYRSQPGAQAAPVTPALPALPYGEWPSPITAADVARRRRRISYPIVIGGNVWWQEARPEDGGRVTVVRRSAADGVLAELVPAPWNARTRVHEYGGLSYLPVPQPPSAGGGKAPDSHAIVFANYDDQRLYITDGSKPPRPITPDPAAIEAGSGPGSQDVSDPVAVPAGRPSGLRYADFALSPDRSEIWCIREWHADGKVTRAIVAVPLDGSAADDHAAVRELVTGSDFFAYPTPSPDGERLAWISWNHPRMPWDGTELRVAEIADGVPGRSRLVKGGPRESVLAPFWRNATSLYVVTDWTGWWNIYQVGLTGEPPQALYPAEEEFAGPLWSLGGRPFAVLGDGRLAVTHGQGGSRLGLLDPETSELTDVDLPLDEFVRAVSADGSTIAAVAGSSAQPLSVVTVDAATSRIQVLRRESDAVPGGAYLPVPHHVALEGRYGQTVHAVVYHPLSPDATGPLGERPPYVVWVHGGPTSQVSSLLDTEKAYFTSRGIGIIDVNYGGSTGYGRLYRERLQRQWGVVDVEDAEAAARWLVKAGLADPARLAIRGGSAGGWTTLAAVTTSAADRVFSAAVSYYGVADLTAFAAHTHDFESRYLDGLIGPLPGFADVYAERAPLGHVSDATCPVLLLQGLDDPIVLPQQSEAIASDLAAHGIPHAYIAFEGESHGFRKAESVTASLEAELSFYGQVLGFTPPGIRAVKLTGGSAGPAAAPAGEGGG